MFNIETMVVSRRDFVIRGGFALVAGLLVPSRLLAVPHNQMDSPQFIPSHELDLSSISSLRASTKPALTENLERLALNAMIDPNQGRIIGNFDKDILTRPIDPASLTKIVTFMVVQDALKAGEISLETKLVDVIRPRDGKPLINDDLNVDDGLKYLMGMSINQIATSLAIVVAGSEAKFVGRMNAKVKELGLANTVFINASGLPGDEDYIGANKEFSNTTTLEDLCKLTVQAVRLYPQYKDYTVPEYRVSEESNRIRKKRADKAGKEYKPREEFASTNPLYKKRFRDRAALYNINGLKTGMTDPFGRGMIFTGERDGFQLAGFTSGHPTRREEYYDTKRPEKALELLAENHRLLTFEAEKMQAYQKLLSDQVQVTKPQIR